MCTSIYYICQVLYSSSHVILMITVAESFYYIYFINEETLFQVFFPDPISCKPFLQLRFSCIQSPFSFLFFKSSSLLPVLFTLLTSLPVILLLTLRDEWGSLKVLVAQSCLTLGDPMDCNPSGFSVHEILQTRILSGCHSLLQGIFPNQGSNQQLLQLLHCRQILYNLSHQGSRYQWLNSVSLKESLEIFFWIYFFMHDIYVAVWFSLF